jgi:hypothetical protein
LPATYETDIAYRLGRRCARMNFTYRFEPCEGTGKRPANYRAVLRLGVPLISLEVMADLPRRAWAVLFLATGLSLVSLALCLSAPPVRADGIAAAHEFAANAREFRRHATLEVAEASLSELAPCESPEPERFRSATPATTLVLRQHARQVVNSPAPRRLLLRPRTVSSRPGADDPIS